nr:unnamed protein product [Digitaria exilis]
MAAAPAITTPAGVVDNRSGYCEATKTFRSLRPRVPLPPPDAPLSFTAFAFSLLPPPLPAHPAILDAATGEAVSFPALRSRVRALSAALRSPSRLGLRHGDVAFVLAPASLDIPALYLALLSFGAVVSPANPALTSAEIARLVSLSGASVAFAVSSTAAKLPADLPTVLLDSDHFRSFLLHTDADETTAAVVVRQSDTAAIQYSSGTTGRVKAAALSHRNFIAMAAGSHALTNKPPRHGGESSRMLLAAPMFHSLGFYFVLKGVALGQTTVLVTDAVARRGVRAVVEAAERWEVNEMTASPPVVTWMGKEKEGCGGGLKALERVVCGGAPLAPTAAQRFRRRFPNVDLCMGYGSTEGGGISLMIVREECNRVGSAGRVSENTEVKIVDQVTGKPLSVGQKGELLVKGPAVTTGYVGDDEANACTFDSEGWLKTGDLCYIDQDGFLFVVDRLKELIKYKGYQVPPAELELVLQTMPEVVDAAVMP